MKPEVIVLPDAQALAAAAADFFIQNGNAAILARGSFRVSLSGGSTPRTLYSLLARPEYASRLDWSRVVLFWGDERCVPPDHPDSDYRMARETLLVHLPPVKAPQVFRLQAEMDPSEAADRYEAVLRQVFGANPAQTFDLLLLGMGDDGHTASLFPGTSPIYEKERWVVAHYVEKLAAWRLTLTPPFLDLSAHTVFLVSGKAKRDTLQRVLYGPYQPDLLPAQVIQPSHGDVTWFVDQDALAFPQDLA